MNMGIEGVKKALGVLKEDYAKGDKSHSSADGAGSGIIGLLEVAESDFTKGLTEMTAQEETAAADYEAYCKEDEVATVKKQQDVKYKGKEAAGLDKLNEMCVAKAEPYAEKKARREAEIAGLKE